MSKIKVVIYQDKDSYEGIVHQEVAINDKEVFCVGNLNECPEDAIIGRDLFDAHDYIKAVKLGLELATKGITELECEIIEEGADQEDLEYFAAMSEMSDR